MITLMTTSWVSQSSPSGLKAWIVQTKDGQWIKARAHDSKSVVGQRMLESWSSFSEMLGAKTQTQEEVILISNLQVPVKNLSMKSLGLGLSYPSHQAEVQADQVVYFQKAASITSISDGVKVRPFTDFEAEVSVLLHRSEPELFGFLLHNDLTDRQLQVRLYDKENPGPGFSEAKSISSFNAHGLILAVGSDELWKNLEINLRLNGEPVQQVRSSENLLKPSQMHRHVFSDVNLSGGSDWVIMGTGTPAGTIFYAPSFWQRIGLFVSSGFSMKQAQSRWLNRFQFLKAGDLLEFQSEALGHLTTRIEGSP